jgi:transcriptional regulator GlxA family with amidase domain
MTTVARLAGTLRVTQAYRLLRQTTCPVSDICFEVGFGNLSNFNRHFRVEMGMSPSEYRLHGGR